MKKYGLVLILGSLLSLVTASLLWASDDVRHQHGMHMHGPLHGAAGSKNSPSMQGAFMKTIVIDGYNVTFHIMAAMQGMDHGGSHSVMIKVEQAGKLLTDIAVNSKVTHPNDKSESKMMMKMGDWYMASYDLNHPGKHQIMVLFKTSDGVKHFGGITYASR